MNWRRIGGAALVVLVATLAATVPAALSIRHATGNSYPASDPRHLARSLEQRPTIDPGKPTAVIVLGADGANVADTLAPYEVFAATGAFNVLPVAPEPGPVLLTGGLDLMP